MYKFNLLDKDSLIKAINLDERVYVKMLTDYTSQLSIDLNKVQHIVEGIVCKIRSDKSNISRAQQILQEYKLSTREGIIMMTLAESLLRIPDKENIDLLLSDKISQGSYSQYIGIKKHIYVNISSAGLAILKAAFKDNDSVIISTLQSLFKKFKMPVIRKVIKIIVSQMGKEFILASNMQGAYKRKRKNYLYSYDMLGEAAVTIKDEEKYFNKYVDCINQVAKINKKSDPKSHNNYLQNDGISVKMTAISAQYHLTHSRHCIPDVVKKMKELCLLAKKANITIFIDAEEHDRNIMNLEILEQLVADQDLVGWNGLGIVVQSYLKLAFYKIDYINKIAASNNKIIPVRLVKGAYWDYEIKFSQENGIDYPVFTRKNHTDISFMACASKLLKYNNNIYPCFATHNAFSIYYILEIANSDSNFEFQKLHGMADALYDIILAERPQTKCRVYAPVGSFAELLPYLARRLLENGANSSFINVIYDNKIDPRIVAMSPIEFSYDSNFIANDYISKSTDITSPIRYTPSYSINNIDDATRILDFYKNNQMPEMHAYSIIDGSDQHSDDVHDIISPASMDKIGSVYYFDVTRVQDVIQTAKLGALEWQNIPNHKKREIIHRAADIMESRFINLMQITTYEAGKVYIDAIAEIKECIDFLRYYANSNKEIMDNKYNMGNAYGYDCYYQVIERGIALSISPWNFPAAIFMGQLVGGLMSGNAVIAKPAEQTPYIASVLVHILFEAGLPKKAVSLLHGDGAIVCKELIASKYISSIIFTGSLQTAMIINKQLSKRKDGIIPMIAETSGQNAMLVDSTALLEQVVIDVLNGAFRSAGQRCSSTRVLYIQDEIFDQLVQMIIDASDLLNIDDPIHFNTDVGPIIDKDAKNALLQHTEFVDKFAKLIYKHKVDEHDNNYFAPRIYEISSIKQLPNEAFGPILHVVRFNINNIESVINDINSTGYALTFGIHSRIAMRYRKIADKLNVGNVYINRNQVGALVGIHPFGGLRKSGTGFKAGGPYYLLRMLKGRIMQYDNFADAFNAQYKHNKNRIHKLVHNHLQNHNIEKINSNSIVGYDSDYHMGYEIEQYSIYGQSIGYINNIDSTDLIREAVYVSRNYDYNTKVINVSLQAIMELFQSDDFIMNLAYIYHGIHGLSVFNTVYDIKRIPLIMRNIIEQAHIYNIEKKLPSMTGENNTLQLSPRGVCALIIDKTTLLSQIVIGIAKHVASANSLIIFATDSESALTARYVYDNIIKQINHDIYCNHIHLIISEQKYIDQTFFKSFNELESVDTITYAGMRSDYSMHLYTQSVMHCDAMIQNMIFSNISRGINIINNIDCVHDVICKAFSKSDIDFVADNIIAVPADQSKEIIESIVRYIEDMHFHAEAMFTPCYAKPLSTDISNAIYIKKYSYGDHHGTFAIIKINDINQIANIPVSDMLQMIIIVEYDNQKTFINHAIDLGYSMMNIDTKYVDVDCSEKYKKVSVIQSGDLDNFNNAFSILSPYYGIRLCFEKTISDNITASGGNAELMLES